MTTEPTTRNSTRTEIGSRTTPTATTPRSGPHPSSSLVELRDVSVTYGPPGPVVPALQGVSGCVDVGDRISLRGPSGSGKSTLLHLMAGLVAPTSGQLTWPGLDPGIGLRQQVGVVFQAPSLIPNLEVVENVELPLLLHGSESPGDARDLALDALSDLELGTLAHALPGEISGGQAQRVAVARVLAARPRLICADEPTGRLDIGHAQAVLDLLLHTASQLDAPLVVATHDPRIADQLATTWPLENGRLTEERP